MVSERVLVLRYMYNFKVNKNKVC